MNYIILNKYKINLNKNKPKVCVKCYVKGQSCMQCIDEWNMLCEVLNAGGNDT